MAIVPGRLSRPSEAREVAVLQRDLDYAHRIIHVLLTRDHGGQAVIAESELKAAAGSWLTATPGPDGLEVRAR